MCPLLQLSQDKQVIWLSALQVTKQMMLHIRPKDPNLMQSVDKSSKVCMMYELASVLLQKLPRSWQTLQRVLSPG